MADKPDKLIGDPSDKDTQATDAAADGQFQQVNRRGGYGDTDTKLQRALHFAKKGGTLAAGEGQMIVEYYEARLAEYEANAAAEVTRWMRRFNTLQSECVWVERRRGTQSDWEMPEHEYRVVDQTVGAWYGDSREEVVDALTAFWDDYERHCAAANAASESGDVGDGGADAVEL